MKVYPVYILGATQLSALQASLNIDLEKWVSAWFGQSANATLQAVHAGRAVDADRGCRGIKIDNFALNLWAVFAMDAGYDGGIASLLLGEQKENPQRSSQTGIVKDLVHQALLDLARRMLGADVDTIFACTETETTAGSLPADAFNPGREILQGMVELGGISFSLWFPLAPLLSRLDWPSGILADKHVELVAPRDALASQRLSGRVILGEAELTLGVLANLRVGDVIQLDKNLGEPLSLEFEKSPVRFSGYLGRQSDRPVFQVDALLN